MNNKAAAVEDKTPAAVVNMKIAIPRRSIRAGGSMMMSPSPLTAAAGDWFTSFALLSSLLVVFLSAMRRYSLHPNAFVNILNHNFVTYFIACFGFMWLTMKGAITYIKSIISVTRVETESAIVDSCSACCNP